MNYHLLAYLQDRGEKPAVAFTRSRPYHKNDNARVEQKNWTHARQLLGYDRLDCAEMLKIVNEAYRSWCLLKNYFVPVMKLKEKTRIGGKYKKRHDDPQTPAERLLAWEGLDAEAAREIRKRQRELNPFELDREVESKLKAAFELLNEQRKEAEEEARWESELDELLASAHPAVSGRTLSITG